MSTSSSAAATVDELRALLRDAESALAGAGDSADGKLVEIRERLRAALDQGKGYYDQLRDQAGQRLHQADDYVRAHPYQAIGVAAAVGAIVGLLVSSRSR